MKKLLSASACLAVLCAVQPAQALVIIDHLTGTPDSLAAGDTTQKGRLTRSGIPSDWSAQKSYPGMINTGVDFYYDVVNVVFAANAAQDVYYQISVDDPFAAIFATAYLGGYDPTNLSLNYLGDAGFSGNPSGNPGFFQIVVPVGQTLSLVFGGTVAGLSTVAYGYQVEAFSDSEFSEDFGPTDSAVPEPATWAMMIAGFGLIAGAMRRSRRQAKVRFAF